MNLSAKTLGLVIATSITRGHVLVPSILGLKTNAKRPATDVLLKEIESIFISSLIKKIAKLLYFDLHIL